MPTVDFDELEQAMMMVGDSVGSTEAWVCRETGKIYVRSDLIDEDEEELPDDIDDSDGYISVPTSKDFDLGQPLVFGFVEREIPQEYGRVRDMFHRKGANGHFSRFLESHNLRDKWHGFRDEQTKAALREWCEENGLQVERKR